MTRALELLKDWYVEKGAHFDAAKEDAAEIKRLTETLKRVNDRLEEVWGDAELALQCFSEDDQGEGMAALKSAVEGEAPIVITRLRAENARLREAGQAVVDWWDGDVGALPFDAIRAALKEGGGE